MPSRAQLTALLKLAAKHGLWAAVAIFFIWRLAGSWTAQLEAVSAQLVAHHVAMEKAELTRASDAAAQRRLLEGICKGVNQGNPSAQELCR